MPEKSKKGLSPIRKTCRSKEKMKNLYNHKVLKMLAVMESQQASSSNKNPSNSTAITPEGKAQEQEFLSTGRTGRRNALPDILNDHATIVTSSDLPGKFQKLSTNDSNEAKDQPGPSSTNL